MNSKLDCGPKVTSCHTVWSSSCSARKTRVLHPAIFSAPSKRIFAKALNSTSGRPETGVHGPSLGCPRAWASMIIVAPFSSTNSAQEPKQVVLPKPRKNLKQLVEVHSERQKGIRRQWRCEQKYVTQSERRITHKISVPAWNTNFEP